MFNKSPRRKVNNNTVYTYRIQAPLAKILSYFAHTGRRAIAAMMNKDYYMGSGSSRLPTKSSQPPNLHISMVT